MNFYIYYHKGCRNIYRIADKQGALSNLTSANSQLASINTLGDGGDSNARSVDDIIDPISKNFYNKCYQALQSRNVKITTQGILYLKSAHSEQSSILGGSSPI